MSGFFLPSFIFLIVCFLASCEKDITVDLPVPESKLVVDGYVEPGLPVYVLLTRNSPYFAPITPNSLVNSFEKGATVTVSDGDSTVQLIELDTIVNNVRVGGLYIALNMVGVLNKTYSLTVISSKGETVTASTTLLTPIPLDSLWFKHREDNDTLGFVWAHLSDPADLGNCYRWFAKRMGKDKSFIAPLGSVFEDRFINGQSFDFAYNRGSIQNSTAPDDTGEQAGFFKTGDTVIVKFCAIDRGVYNFWRDAENQIGNQGSPFASPSNVRSNTVGGLGCFAGYSSVYDTVIAK